MHETSLIRYTLDAVEAQAIRMRLHHVRSIRIVVGDMRGAVPELMQYGFQILCRNRPLFSGAVLEIETREIQLECKQCGRRFHVDDFHAVECPDCGSGGYHLVKGDELYIDSFEGE